VYRTLGEELRKTLGDDLYPAVVDYLEERAEKRAPLPHPSEVPISLSPRR